MTPTPETLLDTIVAGLHARFTTVAGIALCLDHEPRAVQKTPLIYTLQDSGSREVPGNRVQEAWRMRSRLCLSWGDPEAAEAAVRKYSVLLPRAVDGGLKIGGWVKGAFINEVDDGWYMINGVEYRVVDLYTVVTV